MHARIARMSLLLAFAATVAACAGGPVRRVSEPAAQVQQLTVRADGGWDVDLRLQNYSSVPMRFDRVRLAISLDGQAAGDLVATPSLTVGPESADVIAIELLPGAGAKIAVADVLGARRSTAYTLTGEVVATPDKGSSRTWAVKRQSVLTPAPGLPGVLR